MTGPIKFRLVVVLLASMTALAQTDSEIKIGNPGPHFSLTGLNGSTWNTAELRDRDRLLVFGTTWCPHCRERMPQIRMIHERFSDRLDVGFICVRQNETAVLNFYQGQAMSYEVLPDPEGQVAELYHIDRIPTGVYLDRNGIIRWIGRIDPGLVADLLDGIVPSPSIETIPGELKVRHLVKFKGPRETAPARRFIVEISEKTDKGLHLSNEARQVRRNQLRMTARRIGAVVIHDYDKLKNKIVVDISPNEVDRLRELPGFVRAKEDKKVHALLADSSYQIRADYAWANAITGQGVNVCVVDTGIDYRHPDLINKVVKMTNVYEGTDDAMDDNGHGTHVAGIIASEGMVYRGVSHDASLMAAKVLGSQGEGYASDVVLGIQWCVDEGARVINLSLGEGLYSDTCDDTEMAQAVNAAVDAGVVVVCASGNDGNPYEIVSPACASKAIAVGSVDKLDSISSYSDGGTELDLVAPGGDQFGGENYPEIVSTFSTLVANDPYLCMYLISEECYDSYFVVDGMKYIRAVGTSMAAPHVAGAAALLLEAGPGLSPEQVRTLLEQTADDLGVPGWDNIYGHGRINIEKALDNLPTAVGAMKVSITDPNTTKTTLMGQTFDLSGLVECYGGDGCGNVLLTARFCEGVNCIEYLPLTPTTSVSTSSPNPADLGQLSGATTDTEVPLLFDAETVHDPSEALYEKQLAPPTAEVGSRMPTQYRSGDLEPQDGVGAIGEDAEALYSFTLPEGTPSKLSVKMVHYLVLQVDDPNSGWHVGLTDSQGTVLAPIGDCSPETGGGGDPPPPDCWWITTNPAVLSALHSGTNYLKLTSFDVGEDDWLTFNSIEVIVDFEPDPDTDQVYRYLMKFDLSVIDTAGEVTAARLSLNIARGETGAIGEIHLVDNLLDSANLPQTLHEAGAADYSNLVNPIKSFGASAAGPISINIKTAIDEALLLGKKSIALQVREFNNDQQFALRGSADAIKPRLTISQRTTQAPPPPAEPRIPPPDEGQQVIIYDSSVTKDISEASYTKQDAPAEAILGSTIAAEYNTGNLETEGGVGAIGEDAYKIYEFTMPAGTPRQIRVRMEHYFNLIQDDPLAGWYLFTSDIDGNELHLVDECSPETGGGGEPPPPDCWFISDDPATLADLNPGGTSYIKLRSHNVGDDDWLVFNVLEVMIEYEVDPDNDLVRRYYLRFDLTGFSPDDKIDTGILNLRIATANPQATGEVRIVRNAYDAQTGAYSIYNAENADYSSLANPFKTFSAANEGLLRINVRAAVEDAVESGAGSVAFLLTEQGENALFSVYGSSSDTPPSLDVYLKTGINAGSATWSVVGQKEGSYLMQLRAETSTGSVSDSQVIRLNVENPDRPRIQSVECRVGGSWNDCRTLQYSQTLESIRVNATDPQQTPMIHLTLSNLPDNTTFIDADVPYAAGSFTQPINLTIRDGGQWDLLVLATDDDGNSDRKSIAWQIPWGELSAQLLWPTSAVPTPKGNTLNLAATTACIGGECPNVSATVILNPPIERIYDDGTAEDYGDIGASDAYIAVRITPTEYPARLRAARFYIWDKTTYPFELRLWDDNGPGGKPGTNLMPARIVDPVNPSVGHEVQWFDIDLSDRDIVISSGDFYIGWRQIDDIRNNQVGFDTNGPSQQRTWAYLALLGGWFNLSEYCFFDDSFCGNIMIRAILDSDSYYSGSIPTITSSSPFFSSQPQPTACGDMQDGDTCNLTLPIHAVGQIGDKTKLMVRFANTYKLADTAGINTTITAPSSDCTASNLNVVGRVDLQDFEILARQWLSTQKPLFADLNNDQQINLLDLTILADHWLMSCL